MQCQGTTRSGARCRNNSLNGELFCDIHMRVNKSRNLTLIVPGLLTLLACYFILFSLFLSNATYAVFNIPYLQFMGLDDVFLNALKFAGVIGFAVISLWIIYSVLLIIFFSGALIFNIIRGTRGKNASIFDIFMAIVLGLYVLIANMTLRLLSFIPGTGRIKGTKVEIKENRFSRAFLDLRNKEGDFRKGRPLLSAKETLQSYLFFKNMGNHRFSIFTVLLITLTFMVYFTVQNEAARLKNCKSAPVDILTAETYPSSAYQLFSPCPVQIRGGSLILQGLASIPQYLFPHSMILLNTSSAASPLLHLGSTSRFDLLFDPQTQKPVVLPKGINFPAPQAPFLNVDAILQKIQAGFEKIDMHRLWQRKNIENHELRLDRLDRQIIWLENLIVNSSHTAVPQSPPATAKRTHQCDKKTPVLIVSYDLNQSGIRNPHTLNKIRKFGNRYSRHPETHFLISGYADPSGTDAHNINISSRRAEVIGQLLQLAGIPENRIKTIAIGKNTSTRLPRRRAEIRACQYP